MHTGVRVWFFSPFCRSFRGFVSFLTRRRRRSFPKWCPRAASAGSIAPVPWGTTQQRRVTHTALTRTRFHTRRTKKKKAGRVSPLSSLATSTYPWIYCLRARADAAADDDDGSRDSRAFLENDSLSEENPPFGIAPCPSIFRYLHSAKTFGTSHRLPSIVLLWRPLQRSVRLRCLLPCKLKLLQFILWRFRSKRPRVLWLFSVD